MTTKSPDPFWLGPVGIDTSKYQGKVNWQAVKQAGYDFAIIKASEGVGYTDPEFRRNWNESRAAGLLVGAYHFARVSKSPTIEDDARKEAEWFASLLGNPANTLPPMLDIEWDKHADKVIPALTSSSGARPSRRRSARSCTAPPGSTPVETSGVFDCSRR